MYWIGIDSFRMMWNIAGCDGTCTNCCGVYTNKAKESVFLCWDVLKHYKWIFTFSVYLNFKGKLISTEKTWEGFQSQEGKNKNNTIFYFYLILLHEK